MDERFELCEARIWYVLRAEGVVRCVVSMAMGFMAKFVELVGVSAGVFASTVTGAVADSL